MLQKNWQQEINTTIPYCATVSNGKLSCQLSQYAHVAEASRKSN
jgi:hypothetical protein